MADRVKVATLVGDVTLREPIPEIDGPLVDSWFAEDPEGAWKLFLERPARSQQDVLAVALTAHEHRCWVIQVGEPVGLVRLSTRDRVPRTGGTALLRRTRASGRRLWGPGSAGSSARIR